MVSKTAAVGTFEPIEDAFGHEIPRGEQEVVEL